MNPPPPRSTVVPSSLRWIRRTVVAALLTGIPVLAQSPAEFSFTTAGDMRSYTENTKPDGKRFFDGVCEAMARVGPGAFLISPGDFDPPAANRAIIDRFLGKNFLWYIVVGNHEVENAAVMPWVHDWLAADIPHVVRRGLPGTKLTIYSWDFANSHFVAIDTYPWAKAGTPGTTGDKGKVDVTEEEFKWIEDDLAASKQPFLWVTGHQPIESRPDMDRTEGIRHESDSVSYDAARAARFTALLKKYHVRAYICGHTHNTSVVKLEGGVWQCDSGHARGGGTSGSTSSASSFLKFRIVGGRPYVDIYRGDMNGVEYTLRKTVPLD